MRGDRRENSFTFRQLTGQTFRTREGMALIEIEVDGRRRTLPIRGKSLRHWLQLMLYEETGKRPSQAELRSNIDLLEAQALQNGPEAEVHVRAALVDDRVYIDLADDLGRAVEIGPEGWSVIEKAPVHYMRSPGMRPLPIPEKGGSIHDLRSLVNFAVNDDFALIVAWLLDALRNAGAHPVLVINGSEGTAKSTLLEIGI
jgi:hypothetical protein